MPPFSYGHPNGPRDTDPRFETYDAAEKAAIQSQKDHPWDNITAVWEDDSGEVLCIVFEQDVYRP